MRLVGWLAYVRRLSNNLVFAGLRDGYGEIQVLGTEDTIGQGLLDSVSKESIVSIEGVVRSRVARSSSTPDDQVAELSASSVRILNATTELLPVPVEEPVSDTQQTGLLRHRYLALRLPRLQRNLRRRALVASTVRSFLGDERGFVEVETPTLFRPTAEGAREFLVPTRRKPGLFYALPQSPQQYKQLLMSGAIDRYFQIARCYRDEDSRSDRQPEFTQIDLEMSFVSAEEIRNLVEDLLRRVWAALGFEALPNPFPTMRYVDAMARYGVDKPDVRLGMEISDVLAAAPSLAKEGIVASRAFVAPKLFQTSSRKERDAFIASVQLPPSMKLFCLDTEEEGAWKWTSYRNLPADERQRLAAELPTNKGDGVFMLVRTAANSEEASTQSERQAYAAMCATLGALRLRVAADFSQTVPEGAKEKFAPLWVLDFPLFVEGKHPDDPSVTVIESAHHPFTSPIPEDVEKLRQWDGKDREVLLGLRGDHYDVVMNGYELGGGSVRIHDPNLQLRVFTEALGIDADSTWGQFSHLLKALQLGTPPHAGIALGFDRLMCIVCNESSLRDVIAFPKTATGNELMSNTPAAVPAPHLHQYHIRVVGEPEKAIPNRVVEEHPHPV